MTGSHEVGGSNPPRSIHLQNKHANCRGLSLQDYHSQAVFALADFPLARPSFALERSSFENASFLRSSLVVTYCSVSLMLAWPAIYIRENASVTAAR